MRTGSHADEGEPCGRRGQQHCCWESLRDYSLVKLKLQPSQTELLFRSVDDCFFAMRTVFAMRMLFAMRTFFAMRMEGETC